MLRGYVGGDVADSGCDRAIHRHLRPRHAKPAAIIDPIAERALRDNMHVILRGLLGDDVMFLDTGCEAVRISPGARRDRHRRLTRTPGRGTAIPFGVRRDSFGCHHPDHDHPGGAGA